MNYENVFETIKSNLVPTSAYVKSNNEIFQLKLRLQNAKSDLKKMKQKNEDQKKAIDLFQAEKKSLEADKRILEEVRPLKSGSTKSHWSLSIKMINSTR